MEQFISASRRSSCPKEPRYWSRALGDTLFGGKGPDSFAFEPGFGLDAIVNFQANKDTLQFNPSVIGSFFAAMHDAKQIGADTVFTIDSTDKVTLQKRKHQQSYNR